MLDIGKLKEYEYISFDIFDTLIKRNCIHPHDVYSIVQKKYNSKFKDKIFDFLTKRVNSEIKARKSSESEEIEFNDIYSSLEKEYPTEVCDRLKKIEIEAELNICQINNEMIDILEYCNKNGKKVILTSDMYLDKSVIERILDKNNIKYYKLFLSSDFKVTKSSGNLFFKVLEELKINKNEIIHIGDSYKSDYLNPKSIGIEAIHYIKNDNNCYYNATIKNNISSNVLSSFIKNNLIYKEKKLYDWGYVCFGPILYGFTKWLIDNLQKEKINKVYFMARDGYIIKKVFDVINNTNIKSYYLYASRRSTIVPSLWQCKEINEIYTSMYGVKKIRLDKFIKRIGLDDIDLSKEIKQYKLDLEKEYSIEFMKTNEDFIDFMKAIFDRIINNSKKEYSCMKKYLDSVDFRGKLAVVDIGWGGNMQMSLSRILDNDIYGYYVGLIYNQNTSRMKGFLFDKDYKKEIRSNINRNNGIFEFLFLARHGSVKCFNNSKENVEFYDYEYKNSHELELSTNIQEGAIDFVKDINNASCKEYIEFNSEVCSNNFTLSLDKPDKKILETFGNLKFLDYEILDVANAKKISYYFVHPKIFIKDFRKSIWKIGFLNKIIYAKNINYYFGMLYWKLIQKIKKG